MSFSMSARLGQRVPTATAPARRGVIARFANDSSGAKAKVAFTLPYHVEFGQEVAVVGEIDTLGKWDAAAAIPLTWTDGDVWTAAIEVPVGSTVQYKYIIRAPDSGEVLEWQSGDNLVIELPASAAGPVVVKDAWAGEQHELLIGGAATDPAPAPAPAVVDAPPPAVVEAAAVEVVKAAPVVAEEAAPVAVEEAPAAPSVGSKAPIVAAAAAEEAVEEVVKPAAKTGYKPTTPKTNGTKGKGGRRSA